MKNLLIVESPHKAETISQWLNKSDWKVVATKGHIKNLPKSDYGISSDFQTKWEIIPSKKSLIASLKTDIQNSAKIYIATDDDREGTRIAYDIVEHFKVKEYYRIIFHEITKGAIADALKNAVYIDEDQVNAQKARRMIDRILGYPVSNAIRWWAKKESLFPEETIKKMGIGRVSAASLAIIVRNEMKIATFIPEKYKKLYIDYFYDGLQFTVSNKLKFKKEHEEELQMLYKIITSRETQHIVEEYNRKTEELQPYPPLITSRVIRGLNYLYGFKPEDTMAILQKLYEGVVINNKRVGLITYHRTDSYNISNNVIGEITDCLSSIYDDEYILYEKRQYANKNQSAQEAHEAIRPTNFTREFFPKYISKYLTPEEYKTYEFIFYRTLATQMRSSIYDRSKIVVNIGGNKFQAFANKRVFDGWEKLGDYLKKAEDDNEYFSTNELPEHLYVNDELMPIATNISESEDRTPPRYGVGRFITTLEEHNIGRPSTVSTIVKGLIDRGYITVTNNMIRPTEVGEKLVSFLDENFQELVNLEHAESFEKQLDSIEDGANYLDLVKEYDELKDAFCAKIGYEYQGSSDVPQEWLLEKASNIAEKHNLQLSTEQLSSRKALFAFCKKYEQLSRIGKCPLCKKAYIFEKEKLFSCSSRECDCVIWKNSISSFFNNFGKEVNADNYGSIVSHILKNKKIYFNDLVGKKNKPFSAFVLLQESKYKKGTFEFTLSFPKNKSKTVDEKYILDIKTKEVNEESDNEAKDEDYINISTESIVEPAEIQSKSIPVNKPVQKSPNIKNSETVDKKLQNEIKQLKEERRLLQDAALKDPMTRAWNKQALLQDLEELWKNNKANLITFVFIDADHFKAINDTYGHQAGDEVLKSIVNSVFNVLKGTNTKLYRYGGEEFCVVSLEGKNRTLNMMEYVRECIERTKVSYENKEVSVTISMGISYGDNSKDATSLIKKSDEMVYKAKENGRNRIEREEEEVKW